MKSNQWKGMLGRSVRYAIACVVLMKVVLHDGNPGFSNSEATEPSITLPVRLFESDRDDECIQFLCDHSTSLSPES